MSHWLEDAERNAGGKKLTDKEERIRQKMLRVQQNYATIEKAYEVFANGLYELVNRANTLPMERRKNFGMIDARPRTSKIDNHLNVFSSSRRVEQRKLLGFLPPLFPAHIRMVRAALLSASDKPGLVNLEFKEKRTRKRRDTGLQERHRGGTHVLHFMNAGDLTQELALEIIDWLAFSADLNDCSYLRSHTQKIRIINTD